MTNILNIEGTLKKDDLELRILNDAFSDDLEKLANDARIWKYAPHPYYEPAIFKAKWLAAATAQIEQEKRVCFGIFYQGKLVGSTSYYDIDISNKKLTIGYTWLHPDYWGSKVNRLIKLIMLDYVFDQRGFIRVDFAVDSLNLPSQKALQKLGIKQEGLLRNHMLLANGRIRHTYIYSILPEEWPEIRQNITTLLS